ncbi:NUDIX hydrolase [Georgenia sp. 311]|uniref:NUDIX domain-containing protein n=1 Tax=Georgenia sp. 311 TaxID=2585134 RepID=UPI001C3F1CD3|nr:NUDIX hydrolase [Georgenia sp. 311]
MGRDGPPRRMAAHALVRDAPGRVLLVEPVHGATWLLPGGAVEPDEAPRAACARELREELGADLRVGRLLVLDWVAPRPGLGEGLMLVYDGGTLAGEPRLPPEELRDWRWVAPEDVPCLADAELARRVAAALGAAASGAVAELETWG